jgi:hypothetical protein
MCWRDGLVVRTKCCKCVKPNSTVENSSFCYKGPCNSIEHWIRKRTILNFTSFSITQLEKLAFYVHGLSSYARMMHRQKDY